MTGAPNLPDRLTRMLRDAFERAYTVGHAHGRLSPNSKLPPEPDAYFDFQAEIDRLAEGFAAREAEPQMRCPPGWTNADVKQWFEEHPGETLVWEDLPKNVPTGKRLKAKGDDQ